MAKAKPAVDTDAGGGPETKAERPRRGRPRKENAKPVKPRKAGAKKYVPWEFPKRTLEDAIKIAQAIEEKNAGKPLDSGTLAKYVGFRQPNDWRFLDLLRAANDYGLVTGSGASANVTLEKTGEGIVSPSSPTQRKEALAEAFQKVELFKKVADFYAGKQIPEDEYFANTLVREFNVPRDRIDLFIEVFTKNLAYLKSFAAAPADKKLPEDHTRPVGTTGASDESPESKATERKGSRQFLDTCFVLMPFGGWYDRYYEEIYKPAIRDAGFEPVRADDLFHTGSVMEQIWEQVLKAKVLLAELTAKNANVFYELGLAHAKGKPAVFVTGVMDDVPFDLRHLRVIPYDVREPNWASALKANVTAYLRNTKTDPAKSIPQPFRALHDNGAGSDSEDDQDE